MGIKVLSLYDGMSCGNIAFKNLGIDVDEYIAYEIDKYAIAVTQHNFPNVIQMGDVYGADFTQHKDIDWLIGGFPCTKFSIAQKNDRETEPYSGLGWELFMHYKRALNEAKPKYFLAENNKSMAKPIRDEISRLFGFEPTCINSALVSAQNRQRLYWVGKREPDGTYSKVDVQQPEDKEILLRDVLDNAVAWQEKAYALTTRCSGAIPEDTLSKHRHTMCAEPVNTTADGKAQTIKAQYQQTSVANICCYSSTYGATGVAEPVNTTADGKAQTVRATCYKDGIRNMVGNNIDRKTRVAELWDGKALPVYEVLNGLITIKDKQYPIKLADGFYIIRKLTVSECKRLQTVPEWYDFSAISNSQAYKCLGNGWSCSVIEHLIESAVNT